MAILYHAIVYGLYHSMFERKIAICMKKGFVLSLSNFMMLLKFGECVWWSVFLFLS